MMHLIFSKSHVHASFIHTYSFIPVSRLWLCSVSLSLSLSLSLSRIDCVWQLRANLLPLGILLVLGFLLLIHPFFMFSFVIGRPNRTSLRTLRNMAFIRSAMLFCRTFSTLLYSMSFILGDGNLFLRYPWDVLSCLYRSFTPIYTVLVPLYLSLPRHSKVHVS